LVFEVGGA